MKNFSSIFQQFRNPSSSQLNQLLADTHLNIDQLLDQQSLIAQFRNSNPQLLQYLQYDKYKTLVEYITVVGPQKEQKRSYKYPFYAAELLSVQTTSHLEFFLPQGSLEVDEIVYEEIEVEVEEDKDSLYSDSSFRSQTEVSQALIEQHKQHNPNQENKENMINSNKSKNNKSQQNQPIVIGEISQLKQKSAAEIGPDDFPEAHIKKKIKITQQIPKLIKKQVKPLIIYLFQYFQQDINFILTGYTCKIINTLYHKKTQKFLQYFFKSNTQPVYANMIKHIQSRSVGQFLTKIILYDSMQYYQQREEMCWFLLNNIYITDNTGLAIGAEVVLVQILGKLKQENISKTIKKILTQIFNIDFYRKIIQIIISDHNQIGSKCCSTILLSYLQNIIPPNTDQPDNLILYQKLLEKFLNTACSKLQLQISISLKIKLLECISYILIKNIIKSRQFLTTNNCKILLQTFKKYPWNNFIHNLLYKIIISILDNEQSNRMLEYMLNTGELYKFLYGAIENKNHGYIEHCFIIINKIKNILKVNTIFNKISQIEYQKWEGIIYKYLQNDKKNIVNLGGYTSRKQYHCDVMFEKKDIIKKYYKFLDGETITLDDFGEDQELLNIQKQPESEDNHSKVETNQLRNLQPSLQEELQKLNNQSRNLENPYTFGTQNESQGFPTNFKSVFDQKSESYQFEE